MLSSDKTAKIDDALIESEKSKAIAAIAAGLAHELRNPLTIISTTAEYCMQVHDDPDLQDALSAIVKAADNAERILRDLLNFARPAPNILEDVQPQWLIKSTASMIAARIKTRGINLNLDLPRNLPPIAVDSKRLQQALLNFMLNAIDAMTTGGTLTVSAREAPGTCLEIAVADTGCGFTPEQMKHLFEPFRTTKTGGVGLGMAVSRSIIKAHDGTIRVESEPGSGSTITVKLPAASNTKAATIVQECKTG